MTPKAFLQELEKRDGLSEIYQQLIHEKVIDFLQEHAKIEYVEHVEPAAIPETEPPTVP
jgi:hypothetical protein